MHYIYAYLACHAPRKALRVYDQWRATKRNAFALHVCEALLHACRTLPALNPVLESEEGRAVLDELQAPVPDMITRYHRGKMEPACLELPGSLVVC